MNQTMQNALAGKRVLVTQSGEFMGPVLCEVFDEQGHRDCQPRSPFRTWRR